jgi:RNA polymerase sigma-70 factor (ECF subfamily)
MDVSEQPSSHDLRTSVCHDVVIAGLLQRIAKHDESAFRTLYDRFAPGVHRYLAYRTREPGVADELMLDTLMEVWRNPAGYRAEAPFATWLLGIARNKCLERHRRAPPSDEDIAEHAEALPSEAQTPPEALEEAQKQGWLRHCLGRLSEEQRGCLLLVFSEGCSIGEVARVHGVAEGTVKTRLFHARRKLEACIRLRYGRERGSSQ